MKRVLGGANDLDAVHIDTKHPRGSTVTGLLLETSPRFVTVQQITGFEDDGVIVLPAKWIRTTRRSKFERCMNDVLQVLGTLHTTMYRSGLLGHSDLPGIVAHLHVSDTWPAVEVLHKNEASVYAGPITELSESTFRIYCYDAAGEWEQEYEIDYDE